MASKRGPGQMPTRADDARLRPLQEAEEDMPSPAPEGTRLAPLSDDDDYPLPVSRHEGTRMGAPTDDAYPEPQDDDYPAPRGKSPRSGLADSSRPIGQYGRVDETRVAMVEEFAPSPDATRIAPREVDPRGARGHRPAPSPDATRITVGPRELTSQQDSSNRTTFSNQAAMIADVLRERFSRKVYGRNPNRVLRVDEPEGPSTSGGRQARQPLLLVPRKGEAPPIVCGWVDVARREAQIRGHESASKRFQAQHGKPLDVFPADYERFIDDIVETLHTGGLRVRVLMPDEPISAAEASLDKRLQQRGTPPWLMALLVAGSLAAGALAGFLAARQL